MATTGDSHDVASATMIPAGSGASGETLRKVNTNTVTCIRFNQDGSSVVVTTIDGLRVFDLMPNGKIKIAFDFDRFPHVSHVQRIYNSNLVVFVSTIEPAVVKIFNMGRNELISDYRYKCAVNWLAVNRLRVFVAAAEQVFIHKLRNLDVIHTIQNTTVNPNHLYATATYELRSALAFPCDLSSGSVSIYDLDLFKERHKIAAHHSPIAALSMNEYVTRLATCSIKGTVIRVFDVISGFKLHELRRGISTVLIHALAFSGTGHYLACTSDHETVHVFRILTNEQRLQAKAEQGWLTTVGSLAVQATGFILPPAERYMQEERAFLTFQNPYQGIRTELNLTTVPDSANAARLHICAGSGFLNGFLIEKKDDLWTSDLQKAYFLTETVRKNNAKPIHADLMKKTGGRRISKKRS